VSGNENLIIFILLPCNVIIVFQIPTYCTVYLLDKTYVKIRTSNPLKFFNITLQSGRIETCRSVILKNFNGLDVCILTCVLSSK